MPSSTLSKRKTNWGVVLTTAAAIGNSVLPIPVPAFWKPVIGAVAWSTVILCCVAWALTHFTWLARVRLYFASRKRMAFVLVFFVAGLVGVSIYWVLEKSNTESPQDAATHIEIANAFEITGQINSAAPLQKDDVARGYLNGRVDWKVGLASVKPVRGDPQNIEAIFSPTSGRPPNHPLISCVVAKKGHEYLGTMVQRPGELPVFRIKGVLTEIDYEHEHMAVSGASIEQLPQGEETTALTNDQLAKKAARERQPTPAPTVIEHKKSFVVVPPSTVGPKVVPPATPSVTATEPPPSRETVEPEVGPKNVPPQKAQSNLLIGELFALLESKTPLQAVKAMESYKGLWIEAEGETTGSLFPSGSGCYIDLLQPGTPGARLVECYFGSKWCDELDKANPKDKRVLKVRGKISFYNKPHLVLVECDLISSTAP